MKIVAGTYEGFCYGWECALEDGVGSAQGLEEVDASIKRDAQQPSPSLAISATPQPLSLVFGYNVHVGCMKSVAMATSGTRAGQLLVTGGADERVRIYDLRDRTELGELQQHNGTVTCMEFYKSTHLLTGSEDHTVCIWRVHDWALLHMLGGHKAAVTSLSIHPSGRMALSVSRDRTLRLWNLLEGRCAYIKRLQGEGELVRWSSTGDSYLVVVGRTVVVYSAATSEPSGVCNHDARVNSACFVPGDGVATCADDKNIRFFQAKGGLLLGQLDVGDVCPSGRVRDMSYVAAAAGGGGNGAGSRGSLVAVTSEGGVNVWGVPSLEGVDGEGAGVKLEVPLLATHSIKGEPRFTCVAACTEQTEEQAEEQAPRNKNSKKRKQRPQPTVSEGVTLSEGVRGNDGKGARKDNAPSSEGGRTKKSKRKKAREMRIAGDGSKESPARKRLPGGGDKNRKGGNPPALNPDGRMASGSKRKKKGGVKDGVVSPQVGTGGGGAVKAKGKKGRKGSGR